MYWAVGWSRMELGRREQGSCRGNASGRTQVEALTVYRSPQRPVYRPLQRPMYQPLQRLMYREQGAGAVGASSRSGTESHPARQPCLSKRVQVTNPQVTSLSKLEPEAELFGDQLLLLPLPPAKLCSNTTGFKVLESRGRETVFLRERARASETVM